MGIGGERRKSAGPDTPARPSSLGWARRLARSLTLRLAALAVIFLALPVAAYVLFESAGRQQDELPARALDDASRLTAQALVPILDDPAAPPRLPLNGELHRFGIDGMELKLLERPKGGSGGKFYFVAAEPPGSIAGARAALDSLDRAGILDGIPQSCSGDRPVNIRYDQPDGPSALLTSAIPIASRWGCWVLVTSHSASDMFDIPVDAPFWQSRPLRLAGLIYLASALLAILVAVSLRRNLGQFRATARDLRMGRPGMGDVGERRFAARNAIPELTSVAADFDALVDDLNFVALGMKQAADDNAHSFKTPLATIRSSLEPLRRLVQPENARGRRAMEMIDSALARLFALVSVAQRLDLDTAELILSPRAQVDLGEVLSGTMLHLDEEFKARGVEVRREIEPGVKIRAAQHNLEMVIENLFDNANCFTPENGTIAVSLTRQRGFAQLMVEDDGPGIDPDKIDHVFDRYFSLRPCNECARWEQDRLGGLAHAGLGLFIVKRSVEALGGQVSAANRDCGGFQVRILLPLAAQGNVPL